MYRNTRMWLLFYIIFIIGNAQASARLDPVVSTKLGIIKGLKADDGEYSMFLGVPYGEVNASNPFGISYPHQPFDSVFEAYDDSIICPQIIEFENTVNDINCLNLNIYVPDTANSNKKLPVLVWIYGGGFTFGFAARTLYGPKFLVQHDVVLVSINYRVGPYGFLCLDIPEVPGNQGLKDQLLALRWIKNNIAAFNGDDNNITIMGESAGAVSVESHIYSKQEKLFHKAILQSGTFAAYWAVIPSDNTVPLKLAEKLDFTTDNIYEALAFLSNTNANLVIEASTELSLPYRPCIEKKFENVEQFIAEHPKISSIPKASNMPILAGYNEHEDLARFLTMTPEEYEKLNLFYDNLLEVFDFDDYYSKKMGDIVRNFYIGDEAISKGVNWELAEFSSDINVNYPVQRSLKKLLKNGANNIYYYLFTHSGERNFYKIRNNITEVCAVHADELSYLFDVSFAKDTPTTEDQRVIDFMTTLWTNFAKYGNPTFEITELLPLKWLPISNDELHYIEITSELAVRRRPFSPRTAFWDLFYKTNEQYLRARIDHT